MTMFSRISLAMVLMMPSLLVTPAVQAEPALLTEGSYVSEGWSHYQSGRVEISAWANDFVMSAHLVRNGRTHEVTLDLQHQGGNTYYGTGRILVRYSANRGCVHRFAGYVYAFEDRIYLRENTPRHIPFNPNGPCTAAGPYVWFNHPEPYFLTENVAM